MARPGGDRTDSKRRLIAGSAALIAASCATGCGRDNDRPAQIYPGPPLARLEVALETPPARPAILLREVAAPTTPPSSLGAAAARQPSLMTSKKEPVLGSAVVAVPLTLPAEITDAGVSQPVAVLAESPDPVIIEAGAALAPASSLPTGDLKIAALPQAAPTFATLAAAGIDDSPAFVPQISDSARLAYIAQVDTPAPQQRMAVRSGDRTLGAVQFQVSGSQVSVHIGQVLDLFEADMNPALFAHLRASGAAGEFVTLDRIRGAGIPLDYNPAYDELVLEPNRG